MSDERTAHTHRCHCGERWSCTKPDCHIADECSACEEAAMAEWADACGYTIVQPYFDELSIGPLVLKKEGDQ